MASKVQPEGGGETMKAAYITEWCPPGTVPDKVLVGNVPAPPAPKRGEVIVEGGWIVGVGGWRGWCSPREDISLLMLPTLAGPLLPAARVAPAHTRA